MSGKQAWQQQEQPPLATFYSPPWGVEAGHPVLLVSSQTVGSMWATLQSRAWEAVGDHMCNMRPFLDTLRQGYSRVVKTLYIKLTAFYKSFQNIISRIKRNLVFVVRGSSNRRRASSTEITKCCPEKMCYNATYRPSLVTTPFAILFCVLAYILLVVVCRLHRLIEHYLFGSSVYIEGRERSVTMVNYANIHKSSFVKVYLKSSWRHGALDCPYICISVMIRWHMEVFQHVRIVPVHPRHLHCKLLAMEAFYLNRQYIQ